MCLPLLKDLLPGAADNSALYAKQFFGNSAFLVYYALKSMRVENFNAGEQIEIKGTSLE